MKDNEYIPFTMYQHAGTRKALLLSMTNNDSEACWVPKSQIEDYEKLDGNMVKLKVADWIVDRNQDVFEVNEGAPSDIVDEMDDEIPF